MFIGVGVYWDLTGFYLLFSTRSEKIKNEWNKDYAALQSLWAIHGWTQTV